MKKLQILFYMFLVGFFFINTVSAQNYDKKEVSSLSPLLKNVQSITATMAKELTPAIKNKDANLVIKAVDKGAKAMKPAMKLIMDWMTLYGRSGVDPSLYNEADQKAINAIMEVINKDMALVQEYIMALQYTEDYSEKNNVSIRQKATDFIAIMSGQSN